MSFILLLLLILVTSFVYRHRTWRAQPWPPNSLRPSLVQAHRGYWQSGARENSLLSFSAAVHEGYKMFELDVRLSADGIPVVFHDADLKRFSDSDLQVESLTLFQLKEKIDVPTLEEVLITPKRPRLVNIELKSHVLLDSTLEKAVAALVKKLNVADQVMISSFNPLSILKMSYLLPEVPRALLSTEEIDPQNPIYLRKLWLAPYVRTNALHLDHRFLSPKDVQNFVRRGIPVALWTVNEKEKAQDFLKAGALSIISDVLKSEDLGGEN